MPGDRWCGIGALIANPQSGRRDQELIETVIRCCTELVAELSTVRTDYAGHAEEIAAKAMAEGVELVIVIGGDGTVCEVASGLVQAAAECPGLAVPTILIVPAGTGNSLYREIWGDRPWEQAVTAALTGSRPSIRRLDLARIRETGDHVLLGACSGLVAEALVTAGRIAELHGRDRYQEAVSRTLREFTPYPGRVTVDGRVVHEGTEVLANVGGGRYRGGQFMVLPRSVLDDGLLDVCIVGGELDPRELPGLTRDGAHLGRPEVVYERGRRIVIERTDGRPLTFEHDGEIQADPGHRYTLEVLPNAVPVLAPPDGA